MKSFNSYKRQRVRRCWKTLRSRCLVLQRSEIQGLPIRSRWTDTIWHTFRVNPGARCAWNLEGTIHHIENSRKSI